MFYHLERELNLTRIAVMFHSFDKAIAKGVNRVQRTVTFSGLRFENIAHIFFPPLICRIRNLFVSVCATLVLTDPLNQVPYVGFI